MELQFFHQTMQLRPKILTSIKQKTIAYCNQLDESDWITVCPERTADCDRSPEDAFKLPARGDRRDKSNLVRQC